MKILMIPSWYGTPSAPLLGSFYKEQAQELVARGHQVAVLYAEVGSSFHRADNGLIHNVINGVDTYVYVRPNLTPRFEKGRCWQRTRMLHKMYRMLQDSWGRPDVVNLRSSLQGYEAISLCRRYHLPLFFMEHSSYVVTEEEGSATRRRLCATMDAAQVNACVGSGLLQVMKPYDAQTRIIPDMVDEERFTIGEKRDPHAPFTFAAMGQLRPIKGYDVLIRAFAALRKRDQRPMRLLIAGAGYLHDQLEQLIVDLGIEDDCHLVGLIPREETPLYMNDCDCFICSSRTETLSCVLNECGACGRPAISTMCGGPQDIILPETGMLVPVDNAEALAGAMLSMLDKAAQYDRSTIRRLTVERFGRDVVCEQLVVACEEAVRLYEDEARQEDK
ncbi:MAG: glycosyltransferase family 4 protein [Ruminococcaceae bacterium]|nr:glycosyltransferase family 4 protein [Oscillospiraceae bacterium]